MDVHSYPPGLISVLPFAGMLLSIAVLPLLPRTAHWWESNRNRLIVSASFAALTLGYYSWSYGANKVVSVLDHALIREYLPFIVLLFSLYVISGGIVLRGDLAAHPATNTAFLAVGGVLASLVGTTGASMLLIRPLLQTNAERRHVRHTVIFFIFIVSNTGGCLLPVGDPPLFLGYLMGVPFLWTLNLWKEWAVVNMALLILYFFWDRRAYGREKPEDIARDETERVALRLAGKLNFLWLVGVVLATALIKPGKLLPGLGLTAFPFLREMILLALVAVSLVSTKRHIRKENRFTYHAILEVAALFIGIFICMHPPMEILRSSGDALVPVLNSPARFFWATGTLSSFLDNAPTYAVFLEAAVGITSGKVTGALPLIGGGWIDEATLSAVSLGAVFMGANSYIGNGPNFMVRSIAEHAGVRMPGFFGYMIYSGAILLPLFALITLLFFR